MKTRSWITTLAMALSLAAAAGTAQAQQFFRIGTGGTAGTYYPVGGIIGNAVSQPGKLIATAVASNGSVANINGIMGGSFEAGFTQSDVAFWAYSGTGTFEGKPKAQDLRLIATLYPESIHLVTRKGAGIKGVADLKGKRVSMDEPGSGTLVDVRLILGAYGMTDKDIKAEYLKPNQAGDKLKDGGLDAFFFVGGFP
ncbi:MAG: TAXI family TRAP transporter solute-binding subunit, partial [Achromobacter sp.]|nr:TAXI family TRAP transporter solute-binding subunit [Achromobacter sp.]